MTELTEFQRKLSALLPDVELRFEEALAKHTSFRIGGDAEVMAFPKDVYKRQEIDSQTATFPLLNQLFGGSNTPAPQPRPSRKEEGEPKEKKKSKRHKFLDSYCMDLTGRARKGKLDTVSYTHLDVYKRQRCSRVCGFESDH